MAGRRQQKHPTQITAHTEHVWKAGLSRCAMAERTLRITWMPSRPQPGQLPKPPGPLRQNRVSLCEVSNESRLEPTIILG